jgi:hypothetical protein
VDVRGPLRGVPVRRREVLLARGAWDVRQRGRQQTCLRGDRPVPTRTRRLTMLGALRLAGSAILLRRMAVSSAIRALLAFAIASKSRLTGEGVTP